MQGKKIVRIYDKGGWAVFRFRSSSDRYEKSDRQKGNRKILTRQIRRILKRETIKIIEENNE